MYQAWGLPCIYKIKQIPGSVLLRDGLESRGAGGVGEKTAVITKASKAGLRSGLGLEKEAWMLRCPY